MWVYNQTSGRLYNDTVKREAAYSLGYAGLGAGKNNPDLADRFNVGPLPVGVYRIGKPYDSPHTGLFTVPLDPLPENDMLGRGDFKVHGENAEHPGESSNGCIVINRPARERLALDAGKLLAVVSGR